MSDYNQMVYVVVTPIHLSPCCVLNFNFVLFEESSTPTPAIISITGSNATPNTTEQGIKNSSNSNERKASKTPMSDRTGINNNIDVGWIFINHH